MEGTITAARLADLLEKHVGNLIADLRGSSAGEPIFRIGEPWPEDDEFSDDHPEDDPTPGGQAQDYSALAASGSWRHVKDLPGQSYTWPTGSETYDVFEVWELTSPNGREQIGIAHAEQRGDYYGKERGYWLAFEMVNGQKRRPIVVFNEADDYETTGDLVAIIKGKGKGGRSMFAPGDTLPAGYDALTVEVFRDRINGPQAFNRLAVVANDGDRQSMCSHALLQLGLRPAA